MAATSSDRSYRNAPNMRHRTQGRPQSPQEHDPTKSMSSLATSLTPDLIQVPADIIRKWQEIVDLLADLMHVPSASIMRAEPPQIKVFVSSASKGNPCVPGSVDTGPYCETVLKSRQPLRVTDALADETWRSNPHVKSGMISYLGVPISWPDGEIFGTICIRDNKRNAYSEAYLKLLLHFRDLLQADLKSLARLYGEIETREAKIRRLVDANIMGIFVWDVEGRILEANDAFLHIIGYDREDLAAGRVRWTDLTPSEWRDDTARGRAKFPGLERPVCSPSPLRLLFAIMERFLFAAVLIGAVPMFAAGTPPRNWAQCPAVATIQTSEVVYGLGDTHGDYDRLVTLLIGGKLMSSVPATPQQAVWSGGKSILIVTGDMIDKWKDSLKVIALMRALTASADWRGERPVLSVTFVHGSARMRPQSPPVRPDVTSCLNASLGTT